jgi:NAD(P)-dependent dehydrogenase (short-subunit alcohol dehydrogenase family)
MNDARKKIYTSSFKKKSFMSMLCCHKGLYMKIIVIGGNGTLGRAVTNHLKKNHQVITAGRSAGDIICDMSNEDSIRKMLEKTGPVDALMVTAGKVHFAPFSAMSFEDYHLGIHQKLLGQVNLVRIGCEYLQEGGSISLISGILAHDPIPSGSSAAMVNGAVESFVKAVAPELPDGIRINAICPTIVEESMPKLQDFFKGFDPVPAHKVALAYEKALEGFMTGETIKVLH